MSAYYEIYLRPLSEAYDPVDDMEDVLGVRFDRDPRIGELLAVAVLDQQAGIDVFVAELENDETLPDIPYETHPWVVVVRGWDGDKEKELVAAERLFEGLKVTGRYSLVLTLDGQTLIKSAVIE